MGGVRERLERERWAIPTAAVTLAFASSLSVTIPQPLVNEDDGGDASSRWEMVSERMTSSLMAPLAR